MQFPTLSTPDRLLVGHLAFLAVAVVVVTLSASSQGFGAAAMFGILLLVLSQSLSPRFPVLGLGSFVIAAWGLPRYGEDNTALLNTGLLNWLAALALTGCVVWLARQRVRQDVSHWLVWAMAAFIAWGALSMAVSSTQPWAKEFHPRHHPEQFLQGAALLFVATQVLGDRLASRWMAMVLCLLPVVRGALQAGGGLHLETDVPALCVMALPFALLGAAGPAHWAIRAVLLLVAVELVRIVMLAQNRGAAIGLACALAVLWWNSRYRLRWLAAALPMLVAALLLVPDSYIDRFSVLWNPSADHPTASLDRATIEHRLQLWDAAVNIVEDHPLLGVGPSRYPEALAHYLPGSDAYVAHNTPLNVAAEFGIVGLAAYAVLFVGAIVMLQSLIGSAPESWQRSTARMVQASLAAYIGLSMVISRHDMQVAYLLVGWAAALSMGLHRGATPAPGR